MKRIAVRLATIAMLIAIVANLAGCAGQLTRTNPNRAIAETEPVAPTDDSSVIWVEIDGFRGELKTLQQLVLADLIIEGTITGRMTRVLPFHATEAESAEMEALGALPSLYTDYEVIVNRVLKGQAPSTPIAVTQFGGTYKGKTKIDPEDPLLQPGDRVILFLSDISDDPVQAPGQTKYLLGPGGQFRINADNTLFAPVNNPVADTYQGKDKGILEKDILDLIAKSPPGLTKEETLRAAFNSAHLVIEGTIQDVREVRFIPDEGKSQAWIDQMLAEGKMPGLVLTDYAVIVNQVVLDKFAIRTRFLPNRKPIEPVQTIVVTRGGGTYQGVTQVREAGPPFEIGSQEILFLVDLGVASGDADYHSPGYQVRYGLTDSRLDRLLIGANKRLTAFTTKGLGRIYDGQDIGQLEQDTAAFLQTHPFNQDIPAPPQP